MLPLLIAALILPALVALPRTGTAEIFEVRFDEDETAAGGGSGTPLRLVPAPVGASARLITGEDGLPLAVLELPLAAGAGGVRVRLSGFEPGKVVALSTPLLSLPVEPVGEGVPPGHRGAPAPHAAAPAVAASQLVRAGDAAFAHVLVRAATYDGRTLTLPASFRLEVAPVPAVPEGGPPRPTLDGGPVEVVIVTAEFMRSEFEELADFRTRAGRAAAVRTVEWIDAAYALIPAPDRAARIRAFLRDAREQWGTRWVLLGGDTEVIPARYAVSTYYIEELIPADLYYAALDGDWNADGDDRFGEAPGGGPADPGDDVDLVPDLAAGRAPVSTPEEARSFVGRQIAHELGSGAAPDYPASVLFLAEQLFESQDGAEIAEEARALLSPALTVERLYENYLSYPGAEPETRSSALAALERGYGIVNHVGHGFRNTLSVGDGTLGNADVDRLGNRPRLPVFLALNCTSAAIDFNSIGERLVKNPAGGAIAYIGSSRYAFPPFAKHYQNAFFYAAFSESALTVGEAIGRARTSLASLGILDGAHRWTQFALTLLGDPLTPLYTGPPAYLVLRHPPSIPLGRESVSMGVRAGGAPVAGARVALRAGALAGGVNLVTGLTDAAGEVALPVPADARGPLSVTATSTGAWPALGAIAVGGASSGGDAFLSVRERLDIEDAAGGDGDGLAEAGETIDLRIVIENVGGSASTSGMLRAILLSGPAAVIDAEAPFPALEPGGEATAAGLTLRVADSAGDAAILTLDFTLDAPPLAARAVRRALAVAAPDLRLAGRTIDGDGRVDPGETVRYALDLANDGAGTARAVTATARVIRLSTGEPAPEAIVLDGRARFGDLRPGERTAGDSFIFALDPAADLDSLRLEVVIAAALASLPPAWLDFQPPAVPAAVRIRGSESAVVVSWSPVGDPDLLGYEVERAPQEKGPFAVVTPRPVAGALFADSGLPPLTRFVYRVAAVDSSGNQSLVSAVAIGTTNPGLHAGWPVTMGQETASSPVLADLDGDGAAEIVTGADAVYIWRGDASELRDGDEDALTSGIFTLDGTDPAATRSFQAVPAVADLDGDAELEIIAVAWQAAQVFAWNLDGSRLSGWPRSLGGSPNWGSPAVGDLDGDGDLEVAVVGGDVGAVFAWHHDGREVRDGDLDPGTDGVLLATGAAFSFATPALGDLDGGGDLELVVGLDEPQGLLHALKASGGEAPGFPVPLGGRISASPALGDLDGDGELEVVIAVEDDSVHVLTSRGTPHAGWPQWAFLDQALARTSSPVLADLDADGFPEVIQAENSAPPPTQHLAQLKAWRADGSVVSGFENVTFVTDPEAVAAGATQSTPVVGDVDGDGRPEIILGAEDGQLYAWNHDGTQAAGFPIQTAGEVRGSAALGDIDGDGRVEVVMAGWDKNLYVWDLDGQAAAALLPWPFFRHDAQNRGNLALGPPPRILLETVPGGELPELLPPWPNPANPRAELRFLLRRGGVVNLTLFAVDGRTVRRLLRGSLAAGEHHIVWDGKTDRGTLAPSGVYWIRLDSASGTANGRLTVLR